jgi:hypothetical protein
MIRNMKNLLFIVLLLLVKPCFSQSISVTAESLPAHPRILLFDGEETLIHQTIASGTIWKEVHQTILDWSDTLLLKKPVERVLIGKRLLSQARECLLRVCYLSYAWRMTNDDKYFKRAEKEMLAAASFTDWNPDHFLDVSEFTMALSIGYDWLYKKLPENSRLLIREAIIEKGLKPSLISRYNDWLSRSNNWNQVCNAGMAYGALAVYESDPDLSKQIIERAIRTVTLPMGEYNPDGAYNEGYGYWGYGTTFNVMFLSAMEKAFKTDFGLLENKGFFKTAGYMNNMLGTSGQPFNYSDCTSGIEIHPAMFWFAKILNDNSLLWNEIKFAESEIKSRYKFLPVLLIWGSGMKLNNIPEPKVKMWVGRGKNPVALMRTSWVDPDAVFVGIKGGTCQAGHSHMDAGSFVMDADGVRWAMDFGPQGYNSLESKGVDLWNSKQNSQRWQVFRYNNFVHNTLTVNNEFQLVNGYAPLVSSSASDNFMNAIFDLSEIYKGQLAQVNRGIAIVDRQYVVVRDEMVASREDALVRWTFLTSADVKLRDSQTAELTKDNKRLILKVRYPGQAVLKTWTTASSNSYDEPNPGTSLVGFEIKVPAGTTAAFTVFLIPEKAAGMTIRKVQPLKKWNR